MTDDDLGDLRATIGDFFAREAGPEAARQAERDGLDPRLWSKIDDLGLPLIGIPEELGGSGGTLRQLLLTLQLSAGQAAPVPLMETALAAWVLAKVGGDLKAPGPWAVVPGTRADTLRLDGDQVRGVARRVPWARNAERIVALLPGDRHGAAKAVVLDARGARIEAGADLAGLPCDTVTVDGPAVEIRAWPLDPESFRLRGGLLRAAQMAGALEALLRITRSYVLQRHQFGRPIGEFQSVQQHLVVIAQAAGLAASAVGQSALDAEGGKAAFALAAAKLVVGQEAAKAVRAAHQAHGAIGLTREYDLQLLTRRLQAWRAEFGAEAELAATLGRDVQAAGTAIRLAIDDR
jgi:acyl-CoA dehydrogenase